MKKMSTFRFLFYLAIIDLLVLLVCATDALLMFGFYIEVRLYSILACKIHTYITYILTQFSSIVLMVVSIERVSVIGCKSIIQLILRKQLVKQKAKTVNRSRFMRSNRVGLIVLFILAILVVLNLHYLFYIDITEVKKVSLDSSESEFIEKKFNLNLSFIFKNNVTIFSKENIIDTI